MERRELIKSIGLIAITGASTVLLPGCSNDKKVQSLTDTIKEPVKSEREKLIINRTKMKINDPAHPTELEQKHTPFIEIKEKDAKGFTKVDITLGINGIIHPVEKNHFIDYIKLFLDNNLVGTIEYEIGMARGFSSFFVKLDGVKAIKSEIGCNLHGIWENTLNLQ